MLPANINKELSQMLADWIKILINKLKSLKLNINWAKRKLWDFVNKHLQPPSPSVRCIQPLITPLFFTNQQIWKILSSTADNPHSTSVERSRAEELPLLQQITDEAVKLLNDAPTTKLCRLRPAPTWLVKCCAVQLAPIIAPLCNASLQSSHYPPSQKHTIVTARLKKPMHTLNHEELNSFRPIFNLSFLSKIVQQAVAARFSAFCSFQNLFPVAARPSANRQHHSTKTAVAIVDNDIVWSINSHQPLQLVLLDFSASFDTVDHCCLLNIFKQRFAVEGAAFEWFRPYLSDRAQTFSDSRDRSDAYRVNWDVPQGSVLGHFQFIAKIEDVIEV